MASLTGKCFALILPGNVLVSQIPGNVLVSQIPGNVLVSQISGNVLDSDYLEIFWSRITWKSHFIFCINMSWKLDKKYNTFEKLTTWNTGCFFLLHSFSELSPILPTLVLTWLATCSKPLLKQAANKWPKSVIKLSPFGALAPSLGWDALVACCPTMYDRGRISPVKVENNPAAEAWLLTDFLLWQFFKQKSKS